MTVQIELESTMEERAILRARELGVSLEEYVLRAVAHDLDRPAPKASISCIFDLGASPGSDIAREKRKMIAEAFAEAHPRTAKPA